MAEQDDDGLVPDLERELVMISALEHYAYCPRQCALIHLEQTFTENVYTTRGRHVHTRVDDPETERRPEIHREYALPLWSERLGLTGRADLVEFTAEGPYPVEYKSGKRRQWVFEAIQLCAQALCLEEMTGRPVARGAIFYHGSRRRREVIFDDALRERVVATIDGVRALLASQRLPPPVNDDRCRACSLIDACLPAVAEHAARQPAWRAALFATDEPVSGEWEEAS